MDQVACVARRFRRFDAIELGRVARLVGWRQREFRPSPRGIGPRGRRQQYQALSDCQLAVSNDRALNGSRKPLKRLAFLRVEPLIMDQPARTHISRLTIDRQTFASRRGGQGFFATSAPASLFACFTRVSGVLALRPDRRKRRTKVGGTGSGPGGGFTGNMRRAAHPRGGKR